jgi:hypothetical protein
MIHLNCHSELAGITMHPERVDIAAAAPEFLSEAWREQAKDIFRSYVASDVDRLIFSSENLSLLCHADEVAAVMDLLHGREVEVVMYTRNPADFLASYEYTLRLFDLEPPTRPDAINNVSPDSWLVDYQSRIDLWAEHAPVTVIDYDEVVARDGSVIPSFAALVGIDPVDYRLNTTAGLKAEVEQAIRNDPVALEQIRNELASMPAGED